jgi:hypothetical protein
VGGSIGPDDLIEAVEVCCGALETMLGEDWTRGAGVLEWTCSETLQHLAALAYGPVLAARMVSFRPLALQVRPDAAVDELLWATKVGMLILAEVARAAPPSVRAFHPAGMSDASGFVAMGMDELLVHTHDIAAGLGTEFVPDDRLADLVTNRLFPWRPASADPWAALLWANGRQSLPGQDNPGAEWLWHCAPLDEWDGVVPRWDPIAQRPIRAT